MCLGGFVSRAMDLGLPNTMRNAQMRKQCIFLVHTRTMKTVKMHRSILGYLP